MLVCSLLDKIRLQLVRRRFQYLYLMYLIQEKLKKELAEDILFGKLSANGGEVQVSCKADELALTISERKPQEKKELTPAKN